jgi:signal transduction histidine kinase
MKRNLILIAISVLAVLALTMLYTHSQSRLVAHHQDVMAVLSSAREVDAGLNADLLKSRDFMLMNYDPIVREENGLRARCDSLKGQALGLMDSGNAELVSAILAFCNSMEEKLKSVETFKSKNSVLRNSVFFLQSMGADARDPNTPPLPYGDLIDSALSYYVVPNEIDRNFAKFYIAKNEKRQKLDSSLITHLWNVINGKDEINSIVSNILNDSTHNNLEKLTSTYSRSYEEAEGIAAKYRRGLFLASILLLALVIYGTLRILKAARRLEIANERLEERVRERTKELSESRELVIQQQQSLLSSTKMSALGEMAGGVAHEINNPLAIIQLISSQLGEALDEKPIDEASAKGMAESISKTSERIAKIVAGLRTFSRDGSNDSFVRVNVPTLVQDTISFCQERFRNHGVDLQIADLPDTSFEGRATQVSQVLLNLLNNSFDAIGKTQSSWVRIDARDLPDEIEIRVTDSGPGLPPEVKKKLFQPFFTTKEIGKGTGIGLSISLGIVHAHNGTLEVDEKSPNTSFVLRLPKDSAKSA